MEGQDVQSAVAKIDNGKFGKREIRFETGRLARQAAGTAVVYLDDDSMLLSATTASKIRRINLISSHLQLMWKSECMPLAKFLDHSFVEKVVLLRMQSLPVD